MGSCECLASPSLMVKVLQKTSCPKGMHIVVHETPQSTNFLLHASKGKLHAPTRVDNFGIYRMQKNLGLL